MIHRGLCATQCMKVRVGCPLANRDIWIILQDHITDNNTSSALITINTASPYMHDEFSFCSVISWLYSCSTASSMFARTSLYYRLAYSHVLSSDEKNVSLFELFHQICVQAKLAQSIFPLNIDQAHE